MIEPKFGPRLKSLRESRNISQSDVAKALGVNDRQTVSAIENGQRKVSASELVKLAQFFNVSLEKLSNSFLLSSRSANFSWRQTGVAAADLNAFEERAGEWIGAFRELNNLTGLRLKTILPRLGLSHQSSFEDAVAAGEGVAADLGLGDCPAQSLAQTMESQLGIIVLMVDAIKGVSGAACRLPEMNVVLINRNESAGRRNFDLAHELFHILTWEKMQPERIDGLASKANTQKQERINRIERLADNFAAGLLMPRKVLDKLGDHPRDAVVEWIDATAQQLGVTGLALKYRLMNADRLSDHAPEDSDIKKAARDRTAEQQTPELFGKTFMETIVTAMEKGFLSIRRAAALLSIDVDDIGPICDHYGIVRPAEL